MQRAWTLEEDETLKRLYATHGDSGGLIARQMSGLSHLQCRHRWMKVLDPYLNARSRGSSPPGSPVKKRARTGGYATSFARHNVGDDSARLTGNGNDWCAAHGNRGEEVGSSWMSVHMFTGGSPRQSSLPGFSEIQSTGPTGIAYQSQDADSNGRVAASRSTAPSAGRQNHRTWLLSLGETD